MNVVAHAPGRVNVIGDHTDYTGGLVLPAAIDLGTTVRVRRGGDRVVLSSSDREGVAVVPLDVEDPAAMEPAWARYVAAVVAELAPAVGATGDVTSTLPIGAGLSSSAALEVAVALALGFEGEPLALAQLCQRAEQRAAGLPSGIMDQLASAAGVAGALLFIDCRALTVTPTLFPADAALVVVQSGQLRALAGTAYAERRDQCAVAESVIGPLRDASLDDVSQLHDPLLRRRARHVVTENERVTEFVTTLRSHDLTGAGRLMIESHASLRDDFDVSTPVLDDLVEHLTAIPGVWGARMTGGGFGGAVVALAAPEVAGALGGLEVHPSEGARLRMDDVDQERTLT